MGGHTGTVRGQSKAETYRNYVELVENLGQTFQDHNPDPHYKKACKKEMLQDPNTGEWVLHFHLHT